MSLRGDTVDASVVAARRGLFDALEVLGPHASRVVLVGAQAVYVHTQGVVTGVALFTKDADVMLIPPIASAPDIEAAMVAGGFVPGEQPGIWWSGDGDREVDLLVPAAFDQPNRRAARLEGHGRSTARLVPGIEGAIADNAEHNLSASDPGDLRTVQLRVAGPAALLVSKAYKLNERLADPNPDRLTTKDAFDSYRLLQLPMSQLLTGFERMASHEVAGPVAKQGVSLFTELFGRPDAVGVQLAGRYVEGVGEPEIVRLSVAALARELIASLSPI